MDEIVFGGGCFWCTEGALTGLKGVNGVIPGYSGGDLKNPTYEQVCSKKTGHAEVVKVRFDPDVISLKKLLMVFFTSHDPTQLNRQGNDIGPQYRSIILFKRLEQKEEIKLVIEDIHNSYKDKIVTEVVELKEFYEAEKHHHDYYSKNSYQPYCAMVVAPKIKKVRKKFAHLYD